MKRTYSGGPLARLRMQAGYRQNEAAEALGVGYRHLSAIERGERLGSDYLLQKMARLYHRRTAGVRAAAMKSWNGGTAMQRAQRAS